MASGTIKKDNAISKTLLTRSAYVDSRYVFIGMGNLRILQIALTDAPVNSTLCTLKEADRPSSDITERIWIVINSSGDGGTGSFTIKTNGNIELSGAAAFRGTPTLIWTV
jgi:hypothetical protein